MSQASGPMSPEKLAKQGPAPDSVIQIVCTICNRFQGRWKIDVNVYPRGRRDHKSKFTWNELQTSAKSCYGCDIVLRGCRGCFQHYKIDELDIEHVDLRFYYPSAKSVANDDIEAGKEIIFLLKGGRYFEVEVFLPQYEVPSPEEWDWMPGSARATRQNTPDEVVGTAQKWIAQCLELDELCDPPDNPTLPTRVVEVGNDDTSVKLVETKGAKADYICLSHCWGLEQIITTENSTFEDRKKGIPWNKLSKTFQDAIILTRKLGFKYIWIDSLCIIQDDAQDWDIESAKMASVYSNGYLTLAATHSTNGRGGLFSDIYDFEVSGTTPDGEDYVVFFRERIDHHFEMGINEDRSQLGFSTALYHPLLTRAWVYQERMLSARVLHFTRYEIFYECRSSLQCECGNIGYEGTSNITEMPIIKVEHGYALHEAHDNEEYEEEFSYLRARLWRTMVSSYTALFLTKSKDRLPAIGGLAKHMAVRRKSRYLAGLWEDTLNDDLLWTIQATSKYKKPRPYPRNAPTWSWASVETYCHYWDPILFSSSEDVADERKPYQHLSKILDCEVKWSAVDEFGSIKDGSVTISGLLAKGVLERDTETRKGMEYINHYVSFPSARLPMRADYLLDHNDSGKTSPGTEVFCLRMSRLQESSTEYLISLVLRKAPTSPGLYERIGMLTTRAKPPPVDPIGEVYRGAREQTITII